MAIKNSELEYGSRARALHWLVAICSHFVVKSDALMRMTIGVK